MNQWLKYINQSLKTINQWLKLINQSIIEINESMIEINQWIVENNESMIEINESMIKNNESMIENNQSINENNQSMIDIDQPVIYAIFRRVWTHGEVPSSWKESRLKPLFKNKGSMTEAKNYRGLMINATANKVLVMVMLARLKEHYEQAILPSQFGFRANMSTTDGVFMARQITSKTADPVWGCFVDLKAAYDWVDRPTLWRVLKKRLGEQGEKLVEVFSQLYAKTTAKLIGFEKAVQIMLGLRQGAPESCMLFNYWLDTVIRCALHDIEKQYPGAGVKFEYRISNECTDRAQRRQHPMRGSITPKLIMYADDIFVVARSKAELQGMMRIIAKHFADFGLRMAESKTVTMTWNTTEDIKESATQISINDEDLQNVRSFRYLGHWLTDDPKQPKFLKQQLGAALGAWSKDRRYFCDFDINLRTRVKVAEARVRAKLCYALQSDRLRQRELDKIDSVWMRMLRAMVRGGLEREPNKYSYSIGRARILTLCNTREASTFVREQHIKYVAHVCRMENSALQKQKRSLHHKGKASSVNGSDWQATIILNQASFDEPASTRSN